MAKKVDRLPVVKRDTGLSRSSIYKGMKDGTFPQSIKLGVRMVGWNHQEIEDWIEAKLQERDQGGANNA